VVLVVGLLAAASAIASGIARGSPGGGDSRFREVSSRTTPVWLFYGVIVMLFACWLIAPRAQLQAEARRRRTARRTCTDACDFRSGVWMQTLLRDPRPASCTLHHFQFLVLFIATVILEIDHQLRRAEFLHGRVPGVCRPDIFGIVFIPASCGPSAAATSSGLSHHIKTSPGRADPRHSSSSGSPVPRRGLCIAEGTPSFEAWSLVGYRIGDSWTDGRRHALNHHRAM
jgi:hypothetical protein